MLIVTSRIIVRISSEVTKPRDDRPFDGLFNINLELSAMGSPAWENGRYALRQSAHILMDFH
jgi:exosome complex RNA-binding protein Rrp42 (RNase PH superfamily)